MVGKRIDNMRQKHKKSIKGSSLVEYMLLVGLIAAAAIIPMMALGDSISVFFQKIAEQISHINP